jgi:hypothetical protein
MQKLIKALEEVAGELGCAGLPIHSLLGEVFSKLAAKLKATTRAPEFWIFNGWLLCNQNLLNAPDEHGPEYPLCQTSDIAAPNEDLAKALKGPFFPNPGSTAPRFWRSTHTPALMCDRDLPGITQTLLDPGIAKQYSGKYFVCETVSLTAARAIANALGGVFLETAP